MDKKNPKLMFTATKTRLHRLLILFLLCVCVTDDLPYIKCPLHVVLKLTPVAYGKPAK